MGVRAYNVVLYSTKQVNIYKWYFCIQYILFGINFDGVGRMTLFLFRPNFPFTFLLKKLKPSLNGLIVF